MSTPSATDRTPTPSLRRRVTLTVLGLIAVLLLVVGVAVDLALGVQLRRDVHDRLVTTADRATALSKAGTPPAALVNQLAGGNIRIRLIAPGGTSYGDPAIAPNTTAGQHPAPPPPPPPADDLRPPPPKPPRPDATSTVMVRNLPGGGRVILVGDTTPITDVRRERRAAAVGSAHRAGRADHLGRPWPPVASGPGRHRTRPSRDCLRRHARRPGSH